MQEVIKPSTIIFGNHTNIAKSHVNCAGWLLIDRVRTPALLDGTTGATTWGIEELYNGNIKGKVKRTWAASSKTESSSSSRVLSIGSCVKNFIKSEKTLTLTCPIPERRLTTLLLLRRSKSKMRPPTGVSWLSNRTGRWTRGWTEWKRLWDEIKSIFTVVQQWRERFIHRLRTSCWWS